MDFVSQQSNQPGQFDIALDLIERHWTIQAAHEAARRHALAWPYYLLTAVGSHVTLERIDAPSFVAGDTESRVPQDTIDTLVDLARSDREQDFRDLAAMVGVENIDDLWTGTRKRLGK